jgi:hypothetical protein
VTLRDRKREASRNVGERAHPPKASDACHPWDARSKDARVAPLAALPAARRNSITSGKSSDITPGPGSRAPGTSTGGGPKRPVGGPEDSSPLGAARYRLVPAAAPRRSLLGHDG